MSTPHWRQTGIAVIAAGGVWALAALSAVGQPTGLGASLPDAELCRAAAMASTRGAPSSAVEAEITRRGLACRTPPTAAQGSPGLPGPASGECGSLRFVNIESTPRGMIYTVANAAPQPLRFRINNAHIASGELRIAARTTARFGIASDPFTAMAARGLNARAAEGPQLFGCRAAW